MNDDALRKQLTPEEYAVLREKGTEVPYTGEFYKHFKEGMYSCKVCGNKLFSSDTKYDGDTGPVGLRGWPSFDHAIPGAVKVVEDRSLGMVRSEVVCTKCGSHLGHVFDDGTSKTGKHYCINSVCLGFEEKK